MPDTFFAPKHFRFRTVLLKVVAFIAVFLLVLWTLPGAAQPFGWQGQALLRAFLNCGELPDGLPAVILILIGWL